MRTTTRSRVSLAFTCVFMPLWADGFNGLGVEEAPHHVGCPIVRRMNGLAVYDAGDVRCDDGDMEGAQSRLANVVADAIRTGHRPLILGGGHETAWGTFQGIVAAKPDANVGVINIDAHLDVRSDEPGNSGTPFHQIAKWCEANRRPFRVQKAIWLQ